jgi:hypothetical protein
MFDENLLSGNTGDSGLSSYTQGQPDGTETPMNAKLTEPDRRAVDFLLDGDSSAARETCSPLAGSSFMERVHSVQRLLSLLDSMPTEEPPANLLLATLQHMPAPTQQIAPEQQPGI